MSIAAFVAFLLLPPQDAPLEQAWVVEFDEIILGTPVVYGDLVIAASRKGKVAALNIAGGESAWSADARGDVVSTLALLKEKLFVPSGESSLTIDARTGKVLKDKAPGATRAIAGASRVYLLGGLEFGGGYRLGFSRDIGAYEPPAAKALWRESPCPLGVSAAVEAGGRLYVSSQYQLFVLDARTGKELGKATREDPKVPGVPYHGVVDKDRVIFLSEKVMCYTTKNLKEVWNAPVKGTFDWIPPVLTSDRLMVFPLPEVVALDPKTGKEVWTLKLEGEPQFCTSPPAVRGTEVCVGINGKLFAFDAVEGKSTWTFDAGKPEPAVPVPQPVWAGDRLIYAVGRKLFCFKPK